MPKRVKRLPDTPRQRPSTKSIVLFSVISLLLIGVAVVLWAYQQSLPKPKVTTYVNEFGIPITIEEQERDWDSYVVPSRPNHTLTEVGDIPDPVVEVHDAEWLEKNLYRVHSYTELDDSEFEVTLVNIEPAKVYGFDDLQKIFLSTPYANENNYALVNGVNCQGMTCYIADWCEKNDHEYAIEYFASHVAIRVLHRDLWYRFNFVSSPSIKVIEE